MKTEKESIFTLKTTQVEVSKDNPRQPKATDPDIKELIRSIEAIGQIVPGIVRPHPTKKDHYEIGAGSRRFVACQALKLPFKAIVRHLDDTEFMHCMITENLQRVNLTPMQEMEQLEHLFDIKEDKLADVIPDLSEALGKPESWIARRLSLRRLSKKIITAFKTGELQATWAHLEVMARYPHPVQEEVFSWDLMNFTSEDLAIAIQQDFGCSFQSSVFKPDDVLQTSDPELNKVIVAVSCKNCHNRTGNEKLLFPELDAKKIDQCVFRPCFKARTLLKIAFLYDEAKAKHPDIVTLSLLYVDPNKSSLIPAPALLGNQWVEKKSGKPGFIVDNGKVVMFEAVTGKKAASNAGTTDAPEQATKKTQKEKEESLLRRRRFNVINQLRDALVKSVIELPSKQALRLITVFGASQNEDMAEPEDWKIFHSESNFKVTKYEKYRGKDAPAFEYPKDNVTAESNAWLLVRPVLDARLKIFQPGATTDDHWNEAKEISKLIKFDLDEAMKKAIAEIPTPKAWKV